MKLAVIAVGKLKEKYFRDACAEYIKRMSAMTPVEIIEIEEEHLSAKDERNPVMVERSLEREGRRILNRLWEDDLTIALAVEGRTVTSEELARMIEPAINPPFKRCIFIIGSSHGLAPAVYAGCRMKISFGSMTFPHQLARVILLEQIYRGQMILRGSDYHK